MFIRHLIFPPPLIFYAPTSHLFMKMIAKNDSRGGINLSALLKHTTTLFSLSDHAILNQGWRVSVDQVQTNYHGRSNGTVIRQVWPICWSWGILIMVGCVLSQLKPSGFSILSCEKSIGLRPWTFFSAKNGELFGLYPILSSLCNIVIR